MNEYGNNNPTQCEKWPIFIIRSTTDHLAVKSTWNIHMHNMNFHCSASVDCAVTGDAAAHKLSSQKPHTHKHTSTIKTTTTTHKNELRNMRMRCVVSALCFVKSQPRVAISFGQVDHELSAAIFGWCLLSHIFYLSARVFGACISFRRWNITRGVCVCVRVFGMHFKCNAQQPPELRCILHKFCFICLYKCENCLYVWMDAR